MTLLFMIMMMMINHGDDKDTKKNMSIDPPSKHGSTGILWSTGVSELLTEIRKDHFSVMH